jgi:hypothetical protein
VLGIPGIVPEIVQVYDNKDEIGELYRKKIFKLSNRYRTESIINNLSGSWWVRNIDSIDMCKAYITPISNKSIQITFNNTVIFVSMYYLYGRSINGWWCEVSNFEFYKKRCSLLVLSSKIDFITGILFER